MTNKVHLEIKEMMTKLSKSHDLLFKKTDKEK